MEGKVWTEDDSDGSYSTPNDARVSSARPLGGPVVRYERLNNKMEAICMCCRCKFSHWSETRAICICQASTNGCSNRLAHVIRASCALSCFCLHMCGVAHTNPCVLRATSFAPFRPTRLSQLRPASQHRTSNKRQLHLLARNYQFNDLEQSRGVNKGNGRVESTSHRQCVAQLTSPLRPPSRGRLAWRVAAKETLAAGDGS